MTGAQQLAYIFGGFFASILIPGAILILIKKYSSAESRHPGAVYGVCGLLAGASPFLGATTAEKLVLTLFPSLLGVLMFFLGYGRLVKRLAEKQKKRKKRT